jgi:hypothetical protein
MGVLIVVVFCTIRDGVPAGAHPFIDTHSTALVWRLSDTQP